MSSLLLLMRTIFHIFLIACCFMCVLVLAGVMDFADIWLPIQNFFRV